MEIKELYVTLATLQNAFLPITSTDAQSRPVVMHGTRPPNAPITERAAGEPEELGRSLTLAPALSYLQVLQGVCKSWAAKGFRGTVPAWAPTLLLPSGLWTVTNVNVW